MTRSLNSNIKSWQTHVHNYIFCCLVVTKLYLTLWEFMDCSMLDYPVLHYLPELAQTHVHWVSDAIQPSHPPSPVSLLALNLLQHQGLFQWAGSPHQVAKVLELQLQSFQWIFHWIFWFPLGLTGLTSLLSKGLSKSLLQHHTSKESLWWSTLFTVRLLHLYMQEKL